MRKHLFILHVLHGQIVEAFLLPFQVERPLIHILYPERHDLITELLTICRKKYLYEYYFDILLECGRQSTPSFLGL